MAPRHHLSDTLVSWTKSLHLCPHYPQVDLTLTRLSMVMRPHPLPEDLYVVNSC